MMASFDIISPSLLFDLLTSLLSRRVACCSSEAAWLQLVCGATVGSGNRPEGSAWSTGSWCPLEVLDASGHKLPMGGVRQQTVLASLLLRAEQTVPLERLITELWEDPPATASRTLQAYVSRLRHQLPESVIESRPGGYAIRSTATGLICVPSKSVSRRENSSRWWGVPARGGALIASACILAGSTPSWSHVGGDA